VGYYLNGRAHGQGSNFTAPSMIAPNGRRARTGVWRDGIFVEFNYLPDPVVENRGRSKRPPQ
jgi:hypothetical protein